MSSKAASVILLLAVALVSSRAAGKTIIEDQHLLMNSTLEVSAPVENQRYFIYNNVQLTFFEAWHQCRSHGLRLATVKSAEDNTKLKLAFANNDFNKQSSYWIAGTELGKTGSYVWITDNTPIAYTNFLPGQPDNLGGNEHCLEVGHGGLGSTQWNDRNCENKIRYICEPETCDCCEEEE